MHTSVCVCVCVHECVHAYDVSPRIILIENEWHKRYLEQAAVNSQLVQQISQLETQLMNAREGMLNLKS